MTEQTLTVRVPKDLAETFRRTAWTCHQQRPSAALRRLMQQDIDGVAQAAPTLDPPKRIGRRPRQIATYVTSAELVEIKQAAAPYGGIAAWMRGAAEARLGRATELPAREEVQALYAATSELWSVGRNLNQVARALNEAKRAGLPIPGDIVKPELIGKLARAVDRLAERTDAVVSAAKRRGFGRE